MADSAQERTEQATGKRLDEASAQGNVPYSRELTAAVMFLVVLGSLRLSGGDLADSMRRLLRRISTFEDRSLVDSQGIVPFLTGFVHTGVGLVIPMFLSVLVVVLVVGYLQVGFSVRFERMQLRWNKLDPLKGMSKLFSVRSLMTLGQAIVKVAIVGTVVWTTLDGYVPRAADLASAGVRALAGLFVEVIFVIGFKVGALILLLGVMDVFWTRYRHGKDLMMTKEQVKEETKQSEGDPKLRGRVRAIQRDLARARMMQDVKKATVVVRNPTHYAVALRYDKERDPSPRCVAKGRNLVALRIIDMAERNGVPVRTDPPLARRLHDTVKIGNVVPEELFVAVAKVLAWVFRQQGRRAET